MNNYILKNKDGFYIKSIERNTRKNMLGKDSVYFVGELTEDKKEALEIPEGFEIVEIKKGEENE